jgi:Tfp pilus assembly protein PilV
MRYTRTTKGYSLVEVLVAISILMLSIVGPITIAAKSMQSAQYARQQNTAFFLAQEGITMANALRNDAAVTSYINAAVNPWDWTTDSALNPCFAVSGCNIDYRDSTLLNNIVSCATLTDCALRFDKSAARAVYQLQSGDATPYTRTLHFELVNPDELLVISTVQWDSTVLGGTQEVTLSTSLFNLYE